MTPWRAMTNARSPLRALRAALFAVVCVTLAAVGHSSMSAHRLPALALLGAFALAAAVAWAAAGRRRNGPTIAGALFGLQGALHAVFAMAGSHAGDTGHPAVATGTHGTSGAYGMHGMAGTHGMSAMTDPPADPTATTTGVGSGMDADALMTMVMSAGTGSGMLAAHLLAALLCGLWLAHGEAAFFTLAQAALAYAFTPCACSSRACGSPTPPAGRSAGPGGTPTGRTPSSSRTPSPGAARPGCPYPAPRPSEHTSDPGVPSPCLHRLQGQSQP